jgi:parvulin-like peptidyl-prolyl isomerase
MRAAMTHFSHRSLSPSKRSSLRGLGSGLALSALALALAFTAGGCQKDKAKPAKDQNTVTVDATGSGSGTAGGSGSLVPPMAPGKDIDSKDILARTATAEEVDVKHVLLAWKDLSATYGGKMDPRAEKRTNEEAAKLAQELADKLRAKPDDIDALIKEHSEDPGSLEGTPYQVKADSPFVPEFKNLSLRLKEKEVGIVRTTFGYHVIERVLPPPPDPLESSDILKRPAGKEAVQVRHVLLGWKDVPMAKRRPVDPRAEKRTKEDTDKLAVAVLARVKKGEDIVKIMKELSEDPGSSQNGRAYPVDVNSPLVEPFKKLALRLNMNEAGMVKTDFGWHVIQRVPPPPPDKLESKDILERKETFPKVKVKHILLGWVETNAGDPRGAKRTRAELEALVKKTVDGLKKGGKIEPLMKELSEDPGSAASGDGYDVTPDAGLVPPFKELSLRLKMNEVGVVKTDFGIHIIQRVEDVPNAPPVPAAPPAAPPAGQAKPATATPPAAK